MSEQGQLLTEIMNEIKIIKTNMATKQDLEAIASKHDMELITIKHNLESMATKKDLESMATKKDLESMATKKDLESMANKKDLESMATKKDLESMATKQDVHTINEKLDKLSKKMDTQHIENLNADNLLLKEIHSLREGVTLVNRKIADAELAIAYLKHNK